LESAPGDTIRTSYGPYSHAARALALWHPMKRKGKEK